MRITKNIRAGNPVVLLRAKRSDLFKDCFAACRQAGSLSLFAMAPLAILSAILFFTPFYSTLPQAFADDWPQVQKDPQHTGYSPETLGTNFRVTWTYPFQPDRVYPQAQAIIYQGKVFVGTEGANGKAPRMIALYAGNKAQDARAGTLAWEFTADGPILNSAAADNNMVYFATLNGSIYALDVNSGIQVWRNQLMQRFGFSTAVVIADGKVLIGGQDGFFYALDPTNGSVIWKYDTGSPIFLTAAYSNGRVFFGTQDMYFYALNTLDGSLAWRSMNKLRGIAMKDYWPLTYQGKVFVRPWSDMGPNNRTLYIFDEATGSIDTSIAIGDNNTMNGAPTPFCVDREGKLVVPSGAVGGTWQSGWGRLDLATKAVETISIYTGNGATGGYGNGDENLNLTCSQNLIVIMHTQESNAQFTGVYNLDSKAWIQIFPGHRNRQMSSNTQGGGGNPASISNGLVYHISWHELIVRTTN